MVKKDNNIILIIIGIVALFFLFGKSDFMGSVFTTCENIEPITIIEYNDVLLELEGIVITNDNYDLIFNITTFSYPKYSATSNFGDFTLVETNEFVCSQFLSLVNDRDNESEYITLNKRDVLMSDNQYYWCNNANNIMIIANDITILSNYYAHFEICETFETLDELNIASEVECLSANGQWSNNQCLCSDGTELEAGQVCQQTTTQTSSSETTATTTGSSSQSSITTGSSSDDEFDKNRMLTFIILGIALIGTYYFFFEKGPNKGLFKKKRGRK